MLISLFEMFPIENEKGVVINRRRLPVVLQTAAIDYLVELPEANQVYLSDGNVLYVTGTLDQINAKIENRFLEVVFMFDISGTEFRGLLNAHNVRRIYNAKDLKNNEAMQGLTQIIFKNKGGMTLRGSVDSIKSKINNCIERGADAAKT